MLPQELICKTLAWCTEKVCKNAVHVLLVVIVINMLLRDDTREHNTTQGWPVWKNGNPDALKSNKAESDADLWSYSLIRSEHFNPISSEEITLPLFGHPAAEAKQMSPAGTRVNKPFDYCYCFASGAHVLLLHSLPRYEEEKKRSVGLSTSQDQSHQLVRITSQCLITDRVNLI